MSTLWMEPSIERFNEPAAVIVPFVEFDAEERSLNMGEPLTSLVARRWNRVAWRSQSLRDVVKQRLRECP